MMLLMLNTWVPADLRILYIYIYIYRERENYIFFKYTVYAIIYSNQVLRVSIRGYMKNVAVYVKHSHIYTYIEYIFKLIA